MKKLLLSVLLCVGVVSTANSMEYMECLVQEEEAKYQHSLMVEFGGLPKDAVAIIASLCDGASFSMLTQTCIGLHKFCSSLKINFLVNLNFSDVVGGRNKNLIHRFITECNTLMFEQEASEEVPMPEGQDENKSIKIIKRSFGSQMQSFMKNCSMYCISQKDEVCGYVWIMKGFQQDQSNCEVVVSLNFVQDADSFDELYNALSTVECLKSNGHMCLNNKASSDYIALTTVDSSCGGSLNISNVSVNAFNPLGMIMIFIVAACNRDVEVVKYILNNRHLAEAVQLSVARKTLLIGNFSAENLCPRGSEIKMLLEEHSSSNSCCIQ